MPISPVDQCLHDADRAEGGITMAHMMRDHSAVLRLRAERDAFLRQALLLDPTLQDPAWDEIDPVVRAHALTLSQSEPH
jgi:hypothetical protein